MKTANIGEITYIEELLGERPRLLIIGATSSNEASIFLQRFPNGQAAICEPDPQNFDALRPMPRLSMLNCAVGNWTGVAPFWQVPGRADAGSLQPPPNREGCKVISVQVVELGHVLRRLGWARAELLAIDAEGAESVILFDVHVETFPQVSVEFHENWGYYDRAYREKLTGDLEARGYAVAPGANAFYSLFYPSAESVKSAVKEMES
jgi:FkbM family methyltransferase